VLLGVYWPALLLTAAVGLVGVITIRIASVGTLIASVVGAFALAGFALAGRIPVEYLLYGFGQIALIVASLRPNIQRLLNGTERRIEFSGKH
jgi:glycerol-3-phosphate acyltransferase PlsY